ncbi:MAG: phage tail sheath subtilisin-like domain-containing protein [Actinobacteria bacterium]|nr:phage tail sheath subtilisin-like domain-containing protein [Actinomycetota bacterium]
MQQQPEAPGVYIEERSSGIRPITGVPTSITAFVGRTYRGPVDRPVLVTSFGEFERVYGGLWSGSQVGHSVRDFFRNGGSSAVIARLFEPGVDRGSAVVRIDTLELAAAEPGSWGNRLQARVDHDTRPFDPALGEDASSLFNLYVRDVTSGAIEEHRDVVVSLEGHARNLVDVLEQESNLVRLTNRPAGRPASSGISAGDVWKDASAHTSVDAADEASDGEPLGSASFTGGVTDGTGLYLLEQTDLFNLLVIPPYEHDGTVGGDSVDSSVVAAAAEYCEKRRSILLVDPPAHWKSVGAVTAADLPAGVGTASRNAAVFLPRLRQGDALRDGEIAPFAPSGVVAGVIARTDAERGVWKAPAGVEASLVGVAGLTIDLTDDDIGQLNRFGVNCLRDVPDVGPVVWGARTMQGADGQDSEWKYLPVRRTALFIEESLHRGTQWAVFEPNDESLWTRIQSNVAAFMDALWRRGAFQGSTPQEAYLVKCDRGTTTQADVDRGVVNILVGFAPLRPAEVVVIRLQQRAGQSAR